jgi:kindlin 2
LEAHTNVKDLNLLEAKMNFIKAWQSLPDYGVSLFVVRFHGEKKDELVSRRSIDPLRNHLYPFQAIFFVISMTSMICFFIFQLGVAANKIMRMTLNSGDHIKTWRFSTMKVITVDYLLSILSS